ncbi:TatD family hydrolase [Epilithonimonas sp. JDS]|uniref:TatD family hydrolase n=1 Tax=Epilithonimonas sp. JDS TaxID=2902797 RepID=UPI001E5F3A28|nr:TatD family hydrolase [Epilithonimonas sp. JDS]MCD9856474.1 TatD family hydrolase [Epilithonimonas sp. JDS]
MDFLDFHHHKPNQNGIYNLDCNEAIPIGKFSVGLHPKDITENWKSDFEKIKNISISENCLAIGECGLDGLISVDEDLQKQIFQAHISWAEEITKPIIIHCVRRFSQILHYKNAKVPLVIHGFNKKENIAAELLEVGFHLSFGYAALENLSLQNIIKNIPIHRLFLETDDSDFEIIKLYEKVSGIKSISLENLKNQMWENLNHIIKNG